MRRLKSVAGVHRVLGLPWEGVVARGWSSGRWRRCGIWETKGSVDGGEEAYGLEDAYRLPYCDGHSL